MKFKGDFVGIGFDLNLYIRRLNESLEEQLKEAALQWLTAVTGRVPLWSGMARASLLKIAELVNGRIVLAPLKGKSRVPQGRTMGTAQLVANAPDFYFEVSTSVIHYVVQEDSFVGKSPTAPWKSFEAGRAAFEEYNFEVPLPVLVPKRIART